MTNTSVVHIRDGLDYGSEDAMSVASLPEPQRKPGTRLTDLAKDVPCLFCIEAPMLYRFK